MGEVQRSQRRGRSAGMGETSANLGSPPSARRRRQEQPDGESLGTASGQSDRRSSSVDRGAGQVVQAASSPTPARGGTLRSTVSVVNRGERRTAEAQHGQRNRSPSTRPGRGSGVAAQRAGREQQRRPPAARAGTSGVQASVVRQEEVSDRSEGELSGSERDEDQGQASAVDSGRAADRPSPVQPEQLLEQGRKGAPSGGASPRGVSGGRSPATHPREASERASSKGLQDLLAGLRDLVQRFDPPTGDGASPAQAWVTTPEKETAVVSTPVPAVMVGGSAETAAAGSATVESPGTSSGDSTTNSQGKPGDKKAESVRLADAAKSEVYVCFEGPLGAHLKAEVKEKIWKGEYVEIFTLLPLEKFNLDRLKPEERKKEDEEKRRYRLIPRTFSNWLQAFAILASVVGEKAPEHCSTLFVYLDAISEAHRTYGGVAWLRYDEQFRQRMAVRQSLRWDHKDISLWMKLMTAARAPNQFFQAGVGGSAAPGQPTDKKWGFCWQFNEGT
ncbi:hypothetical protein AB205_0195640, partial [Aquarana catesbeiana]